MSFRAYLDLLRRSLSPGRAGRRAQKRRAKPRTCQPRVETLEDRTVPAYLFVDFGDNFPSGTLATTQGAFQDVAGDPTPANRILGTTLNDGANGFNAATGLNIVAQTFTATARAQMMDVVRRAYLPMDVTVVELTANVQTTLDGRNIEAATSMADVINTLRAGAADSRDAYVFVATFIVDPGGANQAIYGPGGGGNSPGGTTLDTTDLNAGSNVHDDVVAVFSGGGFSNNTLNNISHEAGHAFGLQHAITNATNVAAVDLFHQAEIMSYRNTNNTTSSVAFTRYPMIRGDDNSPGGPVVNYNDLAARNGQVTLYDQLRLDGNVLANPNYTFVSGTGAHDIITIARSGSNANVSIQAFADAAYTTPITVPGAGGTTYSYSFPLTNTILVYAGDSNDRIVVDGDLGVNVLIDGMLGNDTLVVNGKGAATAVYTPNATSPTGVDLVSSFGGTVAIGSSSISFANLETAGSVTIQNVNTVTYETPPAGADNLFASRNAAGTRQMTGTVNDGTAVVPLLLDTVGRLAVNTGLANDSLTVDSSIGPVSFANGIDYNGGNGFDRLNLSQTGGASATADTLAVGATNGSGRSIITFAAGTQTVNFENLEPVTDNVPAATLSITSAPGLASLLQTDNVITYQAGSLLAGGGRVLVDTFEPIEFVNKQNLTIDAGAGTDTIDLIHAATPVGLTSITVNAGSGDDTVIAVSGAATPGLVVNGGLGNDYLAANGDLNGEGGNDTLIGGAGDNELSGGSGEDILDGRGGSNSLIGGSETDTILVSGTSGPETITATHGLGSFDITGGLSAGNNTITGLEAVRVEAGAGADAITLNLSANGGLEYTVLGGNPIATTGGDSLTVDSAATLTVTAGPENDAGSVDAATTTPTNVSFDEIEVLIISGGGGGVINGTNGNDAITIIARDDAFNAAADGVQDFTAVVNAGLEILFLNQSSLTVNALGGSDTIVVQAPAPNNAVWDVDVAVDGGTPSAGDPSGSDRLVVETPGAAAETVIYTPTASDAGTLDLTSLSSPITISAIEELIYDGEADNDSFTVVGTGGADVITHTPGSTDQSGAFAVNGLLPISYQNLGASGSLTANGVGGTDVLVYSGTNANDTFRVLNAAGDVLLSNRLVLAASGVEALTMEGLLGDDLFDIIPSIPSLAYSLVNANGGAQASATGDRTWLRATAGADDVAVNGQIVSLGGRTVASSGVEAIDLDAGAGTDLLSYSGVAGTAEAINFISSGVAGQGQVSVPGVALVTFAGVERLSANGNTGVAGDEDTFTFTGTNAVDRFKIYLAAAGTVANPVLLLQNASGSSTLLTLLNYTNFNTLRVNALDGEDVIDVYTAGGGASRNLLVNGGEPNGKKKSTDKLNVIYTAPRPSIVHSTATQNPDAGLVDLNYGSARFLVQYEGIESMVIKRL